MKSLLFWEVTQRWLDVADVLGQLIGPIFKGQAVQEESNGFLSEMSWTKKEGS